MYIKSENMTVMLGSNVTDLIKTIFNFVFSEYRNSLFDKTYYSCHEITLKRNYDT